MRRKFTKSKDVGFQSKNARIIAGTHSINESLNTWPKGAKELWLKKGFESHGDLVEMASVATKIRVPIVVKAKEQLDQLSPAQQGALLFQTESPSWPSLNELNDAGNMTLMLLDGLEDPHNLGAIMRTAWLTGVRGLIIPQHRAVGLTPAVHKVASGGAEHVPVLEVSQFSQILKELKEAGFWIFGLSHKAKGSILHLKLPEKVVWCIGAEDKGLRTTTEKLCDELFRLPQLSEGASYNASVAAGMVLFENFRQSSLKS
jgi:23S rRNA (guanosine2251-2'-O)-methyltransferase